MKRFVAAVALVLAVVLVAGAALFAAHDLSRRATPSVRRRWRRGAAVADPRADAGAGVVLRPDT